MYVKFPGRVKQTLFPIAKSQWLMKKERLKLHLVVYDGRPPGFTAYFRDWKPDLQSYVNAGPWEDQVFPLLCPFLPLSAYGSSPCLPGCVRGNTLYDVCSVGPHVWLHPAWLGKAWDTSLAILIPFILPLKGWRPLASFGHWDPTKDYTCLSHWPK